MHKTPIVHTRHECTKAETSIGGVGSIHRNNRTVMGVARYIRHPAEPGRPRILSVPTGRESTGAVTSRHPRKIIERKQRQITARKYDRSHKIPRRWHAKTYGGTKHTQNGDLPTNTNTAVAGSWKNSTTADGSSFNCQWKVYYGKDVQKVCFNKAEKVKRRFGKTTSASL